ncbi:hypothetical protein LS71_002720 [Helicobacter jaachi]|uniref:Uncharacterized protein n=1 Tax=Helicobacter jaachi TaxID=1677920 RepID=A0A4U8TCI6_9HELI|nr:hypothetical protein [Helicobacter jaachi]TLD97671.1 hypothetical protein LS71_002720 [Helicobacter jaachi]
MPTQDTQTQDTQTPATDSQELYARLDNLKRILESMPDSSVITAQTTQVLETKASELIKNIQQAAPNLYKKSYRLLQNVHLYRAIMVQEVLRDKEGNIARYGDVLMRGHSLSNVNTGAGRTHFSGFTRVALPKEIEFIEVYGGHNVFYALPKEGNFIYVWGVNTSGCAGSGDTNNIPVPIKISLDFRVKKIVCGKSQSTGVQSTLILSEDGRVYGAGTNAQGQLGIGNTINASTFTQSPYLKDIVDIELVSNGSYGYALAFDKEGSLWVFGHNASGNLGNNSTTNLQIPYKITFNAKVTQVAGSINSTNATSFILLEDGSIRGAGYNGHNQLSQANTTNSSVFIRILKQNGDDLSKITHIYPASYAGTCFALDSNKCLWSFGYGGYGYGDGRAGNNAMASIACEGVESLKYADNAYTRAVVKLISGNLTAFGYNTDSALGIGNVTNTREFMPIVLPNELQDYALYTLGAESHLVILCNDSIYACGSALDGSINITTNTLQPQI